MEIVKLKLKKTVEIGIFWENEDWYSVVQLLSTTTKTDITVGCCTVSFHLFVRDNQYAFFMSKSITNKGTSH